jgi:hypothetical protein
MQICYLHIGPHKTASSTVQAFLLENTPRLRDNGIYVPEMGAAKHEGNHQRFAADINQNTDRYKSALAGELRRAGLPAKVIISSENLSLKIQRRPVRNRLQDFFGNLGYESMVIAYIRPQVVMVNSLFTQAVKHLRFRGTFEEFAEDYQSNPSSDFNWRFGGLAADKRFLHTFVPFNSELVRIGICANFLAAIGTPASVIETYAMPRIRNESPGPKTVAAFLEIGRQIDAKGLRIDHHVRTRTAAYLRRMAQTLGWDTVRYYGGSIEQRSRLIRRFAESNRRFAMMQWQRPWNELFGDDEELARCKDANEFELASANHDEQKEFVDFCNFAVDFISRAVKEGAESSRNNAVNALQTSPAS